MDGNQLCGIYFDGDFHTQGTYTAEGVTKLCEGLKGSAVTSLRCAPALALRAFAFLSAPLDTLTHSPFPLRPSLAQS